MASTTRTNLVSSHVVHYTISQGFVHYKRYADDMLTVSVKNFGLMMSPPPFLYLLTLGSGFQQQLSKGVNFASGGAGLLDITNINNVRL